MNTWTCLTLTVTTWGTDASQGNGVTRENSVTVLCSRPGLRSRYGPSRAAAGQTLNLWKLHAPVTVPSSRGSRDVPCSCDHLPSIWRGRTPPFSALTLSPCGLLVSLHPSSLTLCDQQCWMELSQDATPVTCPGTGGDTAVGCHPRGQREGPRSPECSAKGPANPGSDEPVARCVAGECLGPAGGPVLSRVRALEDSKVGTAASAEGRLGSRPHTWCRYSGRCPTVQVLGSGQHRGVITTLSVLSGSAFHLFQILCFLSHFRFTEKLQR